jgi:hypothetical protein
VAFADVGGQDLDPKRALVVAGGGFVAGAGHGADIPVRCLNGA